MLYIVCECTGRILKNDYFDEALAALFAVGRITKFALKVMHLLNCLFNFFFVLVLPVLVWDLAFSYLRHAGGSSNYSLPIGYSINVACGFFKICKCQMKKKKKFKQTNKTETIQSTIEFVVKIFRFNGRK